MAEALLISERSATSRQLCPAHGHYFNTRCPTEAKGSDEVTAAAFVPGRAAWAPACLSPSFCASCSDSWRKARAPFLACQPRHEGTAGNSITAISHAVSPPATARDRNADKPAAQTRPPFPARSVRRRCAVPPWRTLTRPRGWRPAANSPAKPLTFG